MRTAKKHRDNTLQVLIAILCKIWEVGESALISHSLRRVPLTPTCTWLCHYILAASCSPRLSAKIHVMLPMDVGTRVLTY